MKCKRGDNGGHFGNEMPEDGTWCVVSFLCKK